jgi:hypothetical protein
VFVVLFREGRIFSPNYVLPYHELDENMGFI